LGKVRTVNPQALQVAVNDSPTISNPAIIPPDDGRIRLLGGRHLRGTAYPVDAFLTPQAVNPLDPQIPVNQYSPSRYGLNSGIEFTLQASQNSFEIEFIDGGNRGPVEIAIDGLLTNESGYNFQHRADGSFRYLSVRLPDSASARLISVYTPAFPFGGLRLPAGQTIAPLSAEAANYATVVFDGDSITEGAVASTTTKTWIMQAAFQLGIRNPINIGLGSSGYLNHRLGNAAIPGRILNVTTAVNGSPPDAVVIAAGIADCLSFPINDIADASLAYFRALRSAAPNMTIIVLGPFSTFNVTSYNLTFGGCRDTIFAAAQQVSNTYTVDVADWVTPANASTVFDGNVNGPHPVDAGHQIYGDRAATEIRAIIQGLPG
jgi:lysophospholipase L1-like esterase